jgi:hypothetical protein
MPRGYDRSLYILPFDHRGSFQTKMFGWESPLSDAQTDEIARTKKVIYDAKALQALWPSQWHPMR